MPPLTRSVKTHDKMKTFIQLISNKKHILFVFLSVHLINLIWLFITREASDYQGIPFLQMMTLRTVAIVIYAMLSYWALKNIKFVTWIMAVVILFTGVSLVLLGILKVEWHQYMVKSYFMIIGIYFVFGSISLIRKRSMKM